MGQEPTLNAHLPTDPKPPPELTGLQGDQTGIDLSHEVRTSLAVITLVSGNLDLLYERLGDDERRKMIRNIRTHTRKLNDLIDEVLAICNDRGPVTI